MSVGTCRWKIGRKSARTIWSSERPTRSCILIQTNCFRESGIDVVLSALQLASNLKQHDRKMEKMLNSSLQVSVPLEPRRRSFQSQELTASNFYHAVVWKSSWTAADVFQFPWAKLSTCRFLWSDPHLSILFSGYSLGSLSLTWNHVWCAAESTKLPTTSCQGNPLRRISLTCVRRKTFLAEFVAGWRRIVLCWTAAVSFWNSVNLSFPQVGWFYRCQQRHESENNQNGKCGNRSRCFAVAETPLLLHIREQGEVSINFRFNFSVLCTQFRRAWKSCSKRFFLHTLTWKASTCVWISLLILIAPSVDLLKLDFMRNSVGKLSVSEHVDPEEWVCKARFSGFHGANPDWQNGNGNGGELEWSCWLFVLRIRDESMSTCVVGSFQLKDLRASEIVGVYEHRMKSLQVSAKLCRHNWKKLETPPAFSCPVCFESDKGESPARLTGHESTGPDAGGPAFVAVQVSTGAVRGWGKDPFVSFGKCHRFSLEIVVVNWLHSGFKSPRCRQANWDWWWVSMSSIWRRTGTSWTTCRQRESDCKQKWKATHKMLQGMFNVLQSFWEHYGFDVGLLLAEWWVTPQMENCCLTFIGSFPVCYRLERIAEEYKELTQTHTELTNRWVLHVIWCTEAEGQQWTRWNSKRPLMSIDLASFRLENLQRSHHTLKQEHTALNEMHEMQRRLHDTLKQQNEE